MSLGHLVTPQFASVTNAKGNPMRMTKNQINTLSELKSGPRLADEFDWRTVNSLVNKEMVEQLDSKKGIKLKLTSFGRKTLKSN